MGMEARIIAGGPFGPDVANYLEYAAECYKSVPKGTHVVVTVFTACSSTMSRELASAFGFDPWDFARHPIGKDPRPDLDHLRIHFDAESIEQFLVLRRSGFTFFFLPEG